MVCYNCETCMFSSKIKSHYNRHLKTKKHLRNHENSLIPMVMNTNEHKMNTNEHKMNTNEHKMNTNEHANKDKYYCEFCFELFNTKPSKRRHELHYCKENTNSKDKLLNEQTKQIKKMEKTIDKLIDKAGNTTINHIQSSQSTHNQQNIKLNNYGSEDLSHLTDFFKNNLLTQPHGMIPKMIEAVHFNTDKPENKNILMPNKKDNKVKIFSGDKWIYKNKNDTMNDLIDGKYFIMDTHYSNICNSSEKNFNLFKKFQELFDERNKILLEAQKKECELMLLNNR